MRAVFGMQRVVRQANVRTTANHGSSARTGRFFAAQHRTLTTSCPRIWILYQGRDRLHCQPWTRSSACAIGGKLHRRRFSQQVVPDDSAIRAFIALGSNVGKRVQNIEQACRAIDADPDMRVVRTSALYETEPMYVLDQAAFLNGACEIETTLKPMDLLDRLQGIEKQLGRVKVIDKGPRSVDLDILLYGDQSVSTERLTVPHPLMKEREFVLRPLSDILSVDHQRPGGILSPEIDKAMQELISSPTTMLAQTPLRGEEQAIQPQELKRSTQIMWILNMTPDSFSDGGKHSATNINSLQATVRSQIASGTTIIDIGGQSSRPNAADVSAEEEVARVVPAIEAIKSLPEADKITISVDTYRAAVAEASVMAGAHIINDISSGLLDSDMLPTVAKLGCTYIMTHMRGTPATMQNEENLSYPNGVIPTIAKELGHRLDAAQEAGIRRWRIILDPGIGFAKTPDQNLEILRNFSHLKASMLVRNFPWLIGTSRKSFIGSITGVKDPTERIWGTAASVTAAVKEGADIVRVHDVAEMAQVVKVADALYRR